jgi:hypothetical protein
LLAAEVVAATAVVSEAALIYVARIQNLVVSVGPLAFQAQLTIGGMLIVDHYHLPELYRAGAAAAALMVALGAASLIKARLLSRILDQRINNWRWALVWAAAPAIIIGFVFTRFLPEWTELVFGIPAILGIYAVVIWKRGFGPEDRVLFRRNVAPVLPE